MIHMIQARDAKVGDRLIVGTRTFHVQGPIETLTTDEAELLGYVDEGPDDMESTDLHRLTVSNRGSKESVICLPTSTLAVER